MDLQPNDRRLGRLAPDGSIEKWPEVDCFERPYDFDYDRTLYTKRRVGESGFVLIPPGQDSANLTFSIVDMAKFTEPPVETKSRK